MDFNGDFKIKASPETAYSYLVDPSFITKYLADATDIEISDENNFGATVKAGIGFIKGKIAFKFSYDEKKKPSYAKISGNGSGIGSRIRLTIEFDLSNTSGETEVKWKADANFSGKISSIASSILPSAIRKNTDSFIKSITDGIQQELTKVGGS